MLQRIIIEPWNSDPTYVHAHIEGRDGLNSYDSDVLSDMTVERTRDAGLFAKMIRREYDFNRTDGAWFLRERHTCKDLIEMLEGVQGYSPKQIAEIRGQLEDIDDDAPANLTDDQLAFLDWYAREIWKEQAVEVDNPFDEKQTLTYPIVDILNEYCPTPEPTEPRRVRRQNDDY